MNATMSSSLAGSMRRNPLGHGKSISVDRRLEGPVFRMIRIGPFVMQRIGMSYSRLFREFVDRWFSSGGDFVSPGGPIPCINAAAAL